MLIITLSILIIFAILFLDLFGDGEFFQRKKKYDIKIQNKMLNDSLWIKKVIDSCKTYEQIYAVDNLIINWKNLYENNTDPWLRSKVFNELLDYNELKHRSC